MALSVERKETILEKLYAEGNVLVRDLSQEFQVSEETIRRDLKELEKEGRLTRVYGGAYLGQNVNQNTSFDFRQNVMVREKRQIAQAVVSLLSGGETLFLCPSTTSKEVAQKLNGLRNLTVISNSLTIINQLENYENIHLIAIGGGFNRMRKSFEGRTAVESLNGYYADYAFVSCTGVDLVSGLTDASETQAQIRRTMLDHAQTKVLIADHTKFDKRTLASIAPLDMIDMVISDETPSAEWLTYFDLHHIQFLKG